MRLSILPVILSIGSSFAANIVLTSDDGWAELSVRRFYDTLQYDGHKIILSASATNKSGSGSTEEPLEVLDGDSHKLTAPCEYDSCPIGSPSTGSYPPNTMINYVNSYPVTAMRYGILKLAPKFFTDWNTTCTTTKRSTSTSSKAARSGTFKEALCAKSYALATQALEDSNARMQHVASLAANILPDTAETQQPFLSTLSARLHMTPATVWTTILAIASGDSGRFVPHDAPLPHLTDHQVSIIAEEVWILLQAASIASPDHLPPGLNKTTLQALRIIEGPTAGTLAQPDPPTWLNAPPPPRRTGPVDIALAGPNVMANTAVIALFSSTVGAAAAAAKLGVPAIAFSGVTGVHHGFRESSEEQGDTHYIDVYNALSTKFVDALLTTERPYLPYKTFLNINYGAVGKSDGTLSQGREKCDDANNWRFVMSRFMGSIQGEPGDPGAVDLDVCGGGGRLPAEDMVILRRDGCFASVTVGEARGKTMESVEKQGVVWNRLNELGLLSCLPPVCEGCDEWGCPKGGC